VAIVTGASRGIGLAIAKTLLERGASVCITARKADALAEAAAGLAGIGEVMTAAGNAGDEQHRADTVGNVLDRFGKLDLLVNNTGINPGYGPVLEIEPSVFTKTYDTNVIGSVGWIREAHRRYMGEHGGSVVNVSSVAGIRPGKGLGAYGATKAALIGLTRQLAVELAPRVRVNAVAPALIRTQFATVLYEHDEAGVAATYPLGRLGTPEDVAYAVAFLLSPEAGWITGETLVIDGGLLSTGGV
jgi:3-oxoacyl-[acyl-carrier protein] reductase